MDSAEALCSVEDLTRERNLGPETSSTYYSQDGRVDGDTVVITGQCNGVGQCSVGDSSNRNAAASDSPSAAASVNAAPRKDGLRIPRPPNAFMIFAQEFRRRTALQHPEDNNKKISTRLGQMWRALSDTDKEAYHIKAKTAVIEHKKKYPNYVYNPREARQRRAEERKAKLMASQLKKSVGCVSAVPPVRHAATGPMSDNQHSSRLQQKQESHMLSGDADDAQLNARAGDSSPTLPKERGPRVFVETVWPPTHPSSPLHSQGSGKLEGGLRMHSSSPSTSVSPARFIQGPTGTASEENVWTSFTEPSPIGPIATPFGPESVLRCAQPCIQSFTYGPQGTPFESMFTATRSFHPAATATQLRILSSDQRPIMSPGIAPSTTTSSTAFQNQSSTWPATRAHSLHHPLPIYDRQLLVRGHQPFPSPSEIGTHDEPVDPSESRRSSALTAQQWRHAGLADQSLRVMHHRSRHQRLLTKRSMSAVSSRRHQSSALSEVDEGHPSDILSSSMPIVQPRAVHIWSSKPGSYACFSPPVFTYSASMCSASCSLPHAISLTTNCPTDAATVTLPAGELDQPALWHRNTGARFVTPGGIVPTAFFREVKNPAELSKERIIEEEREPLVGSVIGCVNESPESCDQGSTTTGDSEEFAVSSASGSASSGSLETDAKANSEKNSTDEVNGFQDDESSKKTVVASSSDCMPLKKSIMNREMNGSCSVKVAANKQIMP